MAAINPNEMFNDIHTTDGVRKSITINGNILRLAESLTQHMREGVIPIEDGKKILPIATFKVIEDQLPNTVDQYYSFEWTPDSHASLTKEMRLSIDYQ